MSDDGLDTEQDTRAITEWYGRLEDAVLFPDLEYWQGQSDEAKFATAWRMVVEAHELKGESVARRLQRTVEDFQRREG